MTIDVPALGMVLEQSLGHVTHGRNLQRSLAATRWADIAVREIPFERPRWWDRVPPRSNWTVRAGLRARTAVREMQRERPLDALLVHTQVPATMLLPALRRIPTVVSLDATPKQIDALATSYRHTVRGGRVEAVKDQLQRRVFHRAAHLICWSQWAADSLTADYGIDPDRIDVVPPGVMLDQWRRRVGTAPASDDIVRILFVGGDFERKGGSLLVEAVDRLRRDPMVTEAGRTIELHLVTQTPGVESGPGRFVHRGLTPNSPGLIDLYHRCDIFALPTLGDCSPLVLAEAAAAGLATVTSKIGAIEETTLDGKTGHLVDPSVESLVGALKRLVIDPAHRRTLAANARQHAERTLDASANAHRVLERLIEVAERDRAAGRSWLTVSGDVGPALRGEIDAAQRPLADYVAISDAAGAELVDRSIVRRNASAVTRVIEHIAGPNPAMAWHVFRSRRSLDVVVTDGEHVGLPLALLLRLGGRRGLRHVMIGHRLSPRKKSLPTRLLRLGQGVDEVLVYATPQLNVARELFSGIDHRVRLIDFMVDSEFFAPTVPRPARRERPLVVTAGLEFRDYATMIDAVRGLDADVVIASASPWSKRDDATGSVTLPDNVTVTSFDHAGLRELFDRADLAVMPLVPNDFQAGVTTLLEAMSMALPVVCTATVGQIDVLAEGVHGRYVPPGDVAAMRAAIESLLADPVAAQAMGARGRELVLARADVRSYAQRFARIVRWHAGRHHPPESPSIEIAA